MTSALAQTWDGSTSTDWFTGANWVTGAVPTATGTVVIDVTSPSSTEIDGADAVAMTLTVGEAGTGELLISNGGTLTVLNTGTNSTYIGRDVGSTGTVTVTGSGSRLETDYWISVGSSGGGTLNVLDGATAYFEGFFTIANRNTSIATTNVSGAGSKLETNSQLTVGNYGEGYLNVLDGASVYSLNSSRRIFVGYLRNSTGTVLVSGTGSLFQSAEALIVGWNGEGNVTVSDEGSVVVTAALQIGRQAAGSGKIIVTGSGSVVEVGSNLTVAGNGTGVLTISDDGLVDVTGPVRMGYDGSSTGVATLNIGSALGDTAVAPGILNVGVGESIEFGGTASTIVFNHTDETGSYEFAADLDGSGSGTHSILHEAGSTLYTGDGSSFGGTTTINGGTFAINGSLGGAVNIENGGALGGTGSLSGLITINSGGTVAPGNSIGTLNVTNITFNSGSFFSVEIDATGASDLIAASGTATLNGGTVVVTGTPAYGTTYTILTSTNALAGNGVFDDVVDTLLVDYTLVYPDIYTVNLTATSTGATLCGVAETTNQRAVACTGLESLPTTNDIVQAVEALTTEAEARAAYDALSGQIHPSLKTALMDNGQKKVDAINKRLYAAFGDSGTQFSTAAFGGLSARGDGNNGVWVTGYGSWSGSDATANTAQTDNTLGGFVAGLDREAVENWRFGLLGGYSWADVKQDALLSSSTISSWSVGVYGGAEAGASRLSFGAIYNWHQIDTARTVSFTGFSQSLSASYDAQSWQAFTEAGHKLKMNDRLMLEPFAGISVIRLDTDAFSETGGSAALTASSDTDVTTFTTIGVRSSLDLTGNIRTRGMLGWRHAFGDTDPTSVFTLAGSSPFSIIGAPVAQDVLVTEFGFEANLPGRDAHLSVTYDGQYGDGTSTHGVNAGFVKKF